jgi:CTP synthase
VARIPEDRVCYNDSRGAARMGGSDVKLSEGRIRSLYGDAAVVHERHCNRYEIDQQYVGGLALKGLRMVGVGMDSGYPEAFEIEDHPFFAAVVYHPEFSSRPGKPHPLYVGLIAAAKARSAR